MSGQLDDQRERPNKTPLDGGGSDDAVRKLLIQWAAGDEEAARTIYESHYTQLVFALSGLGYRIEDCRDFVQESFLRLHRRLKAGTPPPQDLTAFILVTARNLAFNQHCRSRFRIVSNDAESVPAPNDLKCRRMEPRRASRLVRAAVNRLPEPIRGIYQLRLQGLAERQIAERFGIPVGTVKSLIHRGLEQLRAELEPVVRRMSA